MSLYFWLSLVVACQTKILDWKIPNPCYGFWRSLVAARHSKNLRLEKFQIHVLVHLHLVLTLQHPWHQSLQGRKVREVFDNLILESNESNHWPNSKMVMVMLMAMMSSTCGSSSVRIVSGHQGSRWLGADGHTFQHQGAAYEDEN